MIFPIMAVALLLLVTVYSAVASFRTPHEGRITNWLFPTAVRPATRNTAVIGTVALVLAIIVLVSINARHSIRRSSKFMVPEGYVGWVRVEFQVKDAPPLPLDGAEYLLKFPPSGVLKTSSPEEYGWANDHYFYYSDIGTRALTETPWGAGGSIWGKINSEESGAQGKREYEEFFVGSEQQFREQTKEQQNLAPSTPPATK